MSRIKVAAANDGPRARRPPDQVPIGQIVRSQGALFGDNSDAANQTRVSFVGAPQTIRPQTLDFIAQTGADELIVVSHIYDHLARLRSYELAINL